MIITQEEFDHLRFCYKLGIKTYPVQVHGGLQISIPRRYGKSVLSQPYQPQVVNATKKLFLFRHLRGVISSEYHRNTGEKSGHVVVDFSPYSEYNKDIVWYVHRNFACLGLTLNESESVTLRNHFSSYIDGKKIIVQHRRRSHVEKILYGVEI